MVKRQFWSHVIPSMLAFAFSGLYTIVDGIFVGQNVGDMGLAAINIAYPLVSILLAVGTGVGMSGAIWIAISKGQQDPTSEKQFLGNTFSLLIASAILFTVFLLFTYAPLLKLFGATGIIYEYACSYLKVLALGTGIQVMATGLLPIIRNYNGSMIAMISMIGGFLANIFLDWVFVSILKQGVSGAAIATLIGQVITLIPCIIFIIVKRKILKAPVFRFTKTSLRKMFFTALAPFGMTMCPMLVVSILNKSILYYGDDTAIACYAVISYMNAIVHLLLQGIGDGAQPIIGKYYGAGDFKSLHKVRRMAYQFSLVAALLCGTLLIVTSGIIPELFGASALVASLYQTVLFYFVIGGIFISFVKTTIAYCCATNQNGLAYCLIYGEPMLFLLLIGLVFPLFFGLTGIWISVLVSYITLAIFAFVMIKRSNKKQAKIPVETV